MQFSEVLPSQWEILKQSPLLREFPILQEWAGLSVPWSVTGWEQPAESVEWALGSIQGEGSSVFLCNRGFEGHVLMAATVSM